MVHFTDEQKPYMKSNYFGLWLLLILGLAIIVGLSLAPNDISIGSYTMKKAPIKDTLFPTPNLLADSLAEAADSIAVVEAEIAAQPVETDTVPKSILLFGDSMTFNLALRLSSYAAQNGHTLHAVNWDSSNTKIWADSDTLLYYIRKYDADFIFISLGSNELYFKKPELRLPYVKKILEMIGDRPYVWIGPPNWKEDSGINDMLQATCAPGAFFRSAGMDFKRKKDNIHPTREASALWIDSIMRWMPKSRHPILAEMPSDSLGKVKTNVIFLKAQNK